MESISRNYITIQGWMAEDLHLSGNELLCYALIYGFSQDKDSVFFGSLSYISKWVGCSRRGTINIINRLQEKNLISKISDEKKQTNCYLVKNFHHTSEKSSPPPSEKSSPYNINIDINNINRQSVQDSLSASAENPLPLKTTKSDKTDFPTYAEKKPIQEGFVEFWKLYPRKINKPLAEKKYIKALTKTTADNILKGLKHYITEIEKFNTEEKYIKHPATWLNQECWVFEEELKYQPKLDDEIRAKL